MNNKTISLLELLPKEIMDHIYEFNVNHRNYMKKIIDDINVRNYCLYCNKKVNNIIYILPSRRHLCNNVCYRKLRKLMYGIPFFI